MSTYLHPIHHRILRSATRSLHRLDGRITAGGHIVNSPTTIPFGIQLAAQFKSSSAYGRWHSWPLVSSKKRMPPLTFRVEQRAAHTVNERKIATHQTASAVPFTQCELVVMEVLSRLPNSAFFSASALFASCVSVLYHGPCIDSMPLLLSAICSAVTSL